MKTIQAKLTVTILAIVLVALAALGGLNYWRARAIITDNVVAELQKSVGANAEGLGKWLEVRKTEVMTIARSPVMASGNQEAMLAYLGAEISNNRGIYENIFWIKPDGTLVDTKGTKGNLGSRAYFQAGMKGVTSISDPLKSMTTGRSVVVLATPIKAGDRIAGVLVSAIYIEELEKRTLGIKVGETGNAYMVRGDGLVIIHANKDLVMKANSLTDTKFPQAIRDVTGKMVKGETGFARYDWDGVEKMIAYAPVPGTGWSLALTVPTGEITGVLSSLTIISLVTIVVVMLLAGIAISWFARRIARPIQSLEAAAQKIAGGDLSQASMGISSNDEIGRLAQSFEKMTQSISSLIKHISTKAEYLAASSEELTASAGQSSQASNQIAISIEEVASGAAEQINAAGEAAATVTRLSAGIQQIAANSGSVANQSERVAEKAAAGGAAVDEAIGQMDRIEKTVDSSAAVVAKLGERSKEIGQIVDTISGIAGQTNLLALNAAIEAARAGEQGRGFAVVAEEVRKLAEQSEEAAKKIAGLISDTQIDTDKAVEAMQQGTQEVKTGAKVVNAAGATFREIAGMVTEVSGQIKQISQAIQEMASGSQKIVASVNLIDDLSKKSSDEAQSVSAATEEQLASMEEVATSSEALARLAQELQVAVAKFRL
ncbi:methyl-accepting chemotaxis protein [Anaeroselena agilis]|uniref:Methyl-accepting chemotaxis protein n=1 Tax=Anaeroselena agilis TaxID=3063788 RepID=A0ABU3P2C6_9FIRM|nr:methyl-accepting chemotaxis protein [Selenomonadales bacterium 4137-cl]